MVVVAVATGTLADLVSLAALCVFVVVFLILLLSVQQTRRSIWKTSHTNKKSCEKAAQ